ncbi:hypothetical protein E4U42_007193 [Claviceps africana]|uniref:EthD domain-containing protein n=1 Tax=Claviceps africana TaxID=83212 RepID=A0A8K0NPN0_9HYPO|nr:hypothetical protein E4U42_007193 [Claviceps africana]
MASITILYPSGHDFDLEYYIEMHMALAERSWAPFGLQSWHVTQMAPGQPYQVQAILKFGSLAAWERASSEAGAVVFADIPAFTSAEPLVLKGETSAYVHRA